MFFSWILFLFPTCIVASVYIPDPIVVRKSEAFLIKINEKWFPEISYDKGVIYSASLLGMPDLPHWMFCSHPANKSEAYLYGSAVEPGLIQIEIVAMNKHTYETSQKIMNLKVESRASIASYEVEMKFLNLNVEDMFQSDRLQRLIDVFKSDLWKDSKEIYVTKVVSSVDAGGRLPLNPNEKEGVVVRVGGTYAFSQDLEDLDREVQPLRNRSPCPRNYKKTSVERLFRNRSFLSDWCSFHLVSTEDTEKSSETIHKSAEHPFSSVPVKNDVVFPDQNALPRREFIFDFIISIIIPSATVGILSTALTCIMCCSKDGVGKKEDTSVQLDQYNISKQESGQNSSHPLLGKRDSFGSTPASSFPCSKAPSLTLTTLKNNTLRPLSRSGTPRSLMQPAPPPYTSACATARRNVLA